MLFQQSLRLERVKSRSMSGRSFMSALAILFQPTRAVSQQLRPRRVALFLHQQCEMDEGLVVIGIELEGLAGIVAGFGLVADGVTHQTHELQSVHRWTVPSQMLLATGCRFDQPPLIGQPTGMAKSK